MSEKEKKALETICKAVPKLSEFQKGRLFGMAEMMEEQNKEKAEEEKEVGESIEKGNCGMY